MAVTGLGVVSVGGVGKDAFWDALLAPAQDSRLRPVPDWDPSPWFGRKEARHSDRFAQFAVAAADLALADGGLAAGDVDPQRAGVHCATGMGGIATFGALSVDSLALVEYCMALEDALSVSLPEDEVAQTATVGQFVDLVASKTA